MVIVLDLNWDTLIYIDVFMIAQKGWRKFDLIEKVFVSREDQHVLQLISLLVLAIKVDLGDDRAVEFDTGRRILSVDLFLGLLRLIPAILRDLFSHAVIGEMDQIE